jgi:RHS repeat-associated protein
VARLTGTYLENSGNTDLDSYAYTYNKGNQRTHVARTAGDYIDYTYDNIGQLTTASAWDSPGYGRDQEQFEYDYDKAGNMTNRWDLISARVFKLNALNQVTNSTRNLSDGTVVTGTTSSTATSVQVNGTWNAWLYDDNTFATWASAPVNGNNTFTAVAHDSYGRQDSQSVTVYLPSNVNYSYDMNGNLLYDGQRSFAYDDENELTSVMVSNVWRSEFVYDGKMRRRIRKEYEWNGSYWLQTNEVRYIYDGNVVLQERDGNNLPQVTYTRGTDLSASLQGAGGIGGLLARTSNSQLLTSSADAHAYYHADGNGNITALINANQLIAAKYLYNPFGGILNRSGPLADENVYRFSSKEYDLNSGLVYYLYRYYEPNLQKWLYRDPLAEPFDRNLYRFTYNNSINFGDPNGLWGVAFGNNSGSFYINFGWGDPAVYFSPDLAHGFGESAAATADGLIPFADPFASHGFYDPCDNWNQFSYTMGKVAQVSLTSAAGLGAVRAANGLFMPSIVYHFTSVEGAAEIAATGGIEAGSGFYGTGVYLTGFNSAAIATIQGATSTEVAIAVSTEGLVISPTIFPGTYIIREASLLLP